MKYVLLRKLPAPVHVAAVCVTRHPEKGQQNSPVWNHFCIQCFYGSCFRFPLSDGAAAPVETVIASVV